MLLLRDYPGSRLCGHRDLSPDLNGNGEIEPEEWIKECPCFDAAAIVREAAPPNPGVCGVRGDVFSVFPVSFQICPILLWHEKRLCQ